MVTLYIFISEMPVTTPVETQDEDMSNICNEDAAPNNTASSNTSNGKKYVKEMAIFEMFKLVLIFDFTFQQRGRATLGRPQGLVQRQQR
jgi:hypothetical protein